MRLRPRQNQIVEEQPFPYNDLLFYGKSKLSISFKKNEEDAVIENKFYMFFFLAYASAAWSMQKNLPQETELTEILLVSNDAPLHNQKDAKPYVALLSKLSCSLPAEPTTQQIQQVVSSQNGIQIIKEYENIYRKKVDARNSLIVQRNIEEQSAQRARRHTIKYSSSFGLLLFFSALLIVGGESQFNVNWGQFITQNNLLFLLPFLYIFWKLPAGTVNNYRTYTTLKKNIPLLENAIENYADNEARYNPDDPFYWKLTKVTTRTMADA